MRAGARLIFFVRCSDGKRRHLVGFLRMEDAREWAEWGHCCIRSHAFETEQREVRI